MRATIKMIAERAGVSIGTVDRVLHDRPYVKEEVRRRVLEVMEELDRQIDAALPRKLTLDLAGLTFTDSSGIAVVLRTFRRMRQLQGSMAVVNAPEQARRVFQAAGLDKLVPFEPDVKSNPGG